MFKVGDVIKFKLKEAKCTYGLTDVMLPLVDRYFIGSVICYIENTILLDGSIDIDVPELGAYSYGMKDVILFKENKVNTKPVWF